MHEIKSEQLLKYFDPLADKVPKSLAWISYSVPIDCMDAGGH